MSRSTDVRRIERLKRGVFSCSLDGQRLLMAWPAQLSVPTDDDTSTTLAELASSGREAGSGDLLSSRLRDGGWLSEEFLDEDASPAFTVNPLRPASAARPADGAELQLSRFAVIRAHRDGGLLIESPLATAEIVLHRHDLLPGALRTPDSDLARRLREQLLAHGFLVDRLGGETTELRYRQWSPHELLFHDRSRLGYRGYVGDDFGGTWWGSKADLPAEPARPEPYDGPRVGLPVPDLAARRRTDPPYCEVVERRRSERLHDDSSPISAAELGELLYRTARVRGVRAEDSLEFVSGPRPSGGSVYELEIYPVITRCEGIAPGMYHYDAHTHELELVRPLEHPSVRRMLRVASNASTTARNPQVLLAVSARVGRIMWKYQAMGYSLVLKNTGVLFDALGGACTAMGLAGCALGTDDAVAFTEATERDPLVECSVGQFIVGSSMRVAA